MCIIYTHDRRNVCERRYTHEKEKTKQYGETLIAMNLARLEIVVHLPVLTSLKALHKTHRGKIQLIQAVGRGLGQAPTSGEGFCSHPRSNPEVHPVSSCVRFRVSREQQPPEQWPTLCPRGSDFKSKHTKS